MVKTAPDDPDYLVTELARNAMASDASQLPLKEILAILPLPASFLPRKTLILTATAAHLIKPSTLGFIRSHENSSVYSPTMRQVIVQKLYHGTAKKLPKMLTGPCYAFMPLAAPDHRNVGWIATHRLVDYAITNRQHHRIVTVRFQKGRTLTLTTTYHAARFGEILAGSNLLMDVISQLARIAEGNLPLTKDAQQQHHIVVTATMARTLMNTTHQREAYFGAKQVVGEEEYRLQAGWDEGLGGDGV